MRLRKPPALTKDGEAFLRKINGIEATLEPILQPQPNVVKVSAGSWMTQALCARADQITDPDIQLHFIAADHDLDILHREAVIGIRNRRPEQAGLACRKVGQVTFAGYAAAPDLPWIKTTGNTPSALWLSDQISPLTVSAPRNALDLAQSGLGTALLPTFIGDETKLKKQCDIPDLTHDQWLVSHDTARFHPKVRVTIDRLYTVLAQLHQS